jgi:hypothetical protein
MGLSQLEGNTHVNGRLSARSMLIPAGTITNAMVAAGAAIEAAKLEHQHQVPYSQGGAATAVADRRMIHRVYGATGSVLKFSASAVVKMTDGGSDDFSVTIDLKKNGSSILTTPIVLDKSTLTANYLDVDGMLSASSLAAGDVLEVTVAVAGSVGTQAIGVYANTVLRELAA